MADELISIERLERFKNDTENKSYDPSKFSGLGVCTLKKNVQTVSGTQKNVLTQAVFKDSDNNLLENMVYVIKYDFDLNGSTIEIGSNCVLKFEGGSISGGANGGALVCNNTTIEASPLHIFDNVVLSGTIVGDVVLNHFTHSADCVASRKNLGCAIHVIGECTIDAPMFVESDFSIYGDDMYKTKLMLSSSYSGVVKTVFEFDPANVGIYRTTFRNFSVNASTSYPLQYAFYRYQSDPIEGGPIMIASFENLQLDDLGVSAFSFRSSGLGCVNFINLHFRGSYYTEAVIDYYGCWFNDNIIERCRYSSGSSKSFLKVRSINRVTGGSTTAAQITHNNVLNNYFEKISLKEVTGGISNRWLNTLWLFDIECESTIYDLNIEGNYFEDIKELSQDQNSNYGSLFRVYTPAGVSGNPPRARQVSFIGNTIVKSPRRTFGFYAVSNLGIFNNGAYGAYIRIYAEIKADVSYEYNNSATVSYDATPDGLPGTPVVVVQNIDNKVDKEVGKGLSTNDYSNTEKSKVAAALTSTDLAVETNRAMAAEEALRQLYNSLSQSQPIPLTQAEWAAMTTYQQGVIYRVAGTTDYTDYMYNGTNVVPMATYNNAIDNTPTIGSDNLAKSNGIARELISKVKTSSPDELYDRSTVIVHTDLTTDGGVESASQTYNCSPFIAVNPDMMLYVTAYNNHIYCYDAQRAYLGRFVNVEGLKLRSLSSTLEDVAFVRICFIDSMISTARVALSQEENPIRSYLTSHNTFKIGTYNVGDFSGDGLVTPSAAGSLAYRKTIGKLDVDILALQEDVRYYGGMSTGEDVRTAIYPMYKNLYREGTGQYNFKSFASDYNLSVTYKYYDTSDGTYYNHGFFLFGVMSVGNKRVVIVNVHWDWNDVTVRRKQIQQCIDFADNYDCSIILGDTNPEDRSSGSPVNVCDEDWAILTNAGYKKANGGDFGYFNTCQIYEGVWWPNDNIFVKNMTIRNVWIDQESYMNDHIPFCATVSV